MDEPPPGAESQRRERDALGDFDVPAGALWGVHTGRAAANFALSGRSTDPRLIRAYAQVKKACCLANLELGYLDGRRAFAIETACDEIASGLWADQFPLDALQGGAGTSTNMNLNEVIANRANALLGLPSGSYGGEGVDPLAHVNLHQSTNDTYPTALRLCLIGMVRDLASAAASLQGVLQRKESAFAGVVAIGRTELQSAVPMTLGAQFSAFAECVGRDRWRTFKCEERLRVVNLGGTAVGTGLTAPRRYIFRVVDLLRQQTGYPLARGENLVDQTSNLDALAEVSGILKAHAANLVKIGRDLRFLAQAGELSLTPVQAGSSIMPGKVNPVILEATIQAGLRAMANDALVGQAVALGSLQINEYLPLIADALTETVTLLMRADRMLAGHLESVTADEDACRRHVDEDPMTITALLPDIGYAAAAALLEEYRAAVTAYPREPGGTGGTRGPTLREFLSARLGPELVDRRFSAAALSALGYQEVP